MSDTTETDARQCCRSVRGETHYDCPTTGHNVHGVAMCVCKRYGPAHAWEPGESCGTRVIPPTPTEAVS